MAARPRIITQDAFSVAPQLLGLPLASPARRALAIAMDFILVSALTKVGGALLGLAAAFLLWRISGRGGPEGFLKPSVRTILRVLAAIVLFIVVVNIWGNRDGQEDEPDIESVVAEATSGDSDFDLNVQNLNLGAGGTVNLFRWGIELRATNDSVRAQRLADSLAALLKRGGASADQLNDLREGVHEAAGTDEKEESVRRAIDRAFGASPSATPIAQELAQSYLTAVQAGDEEAADQARARLRDVLAGRELARARARAERQEDRADSLEAVNERRERRSVRAIMGGFADDLGLGFGWLALYFTASLVLLKGKTPGKMVMGLRVVRLDAKPISWFISFERFGGYAASAAVGLLGFLQILWDRNRQGLHDKAVETVVIQETRKT